ncbi:conserved hypothetical protein [Perkinsus marinus ATCC 50983]|uniref:Probable enoyl-CoA hydratase, mitochondrial n=1 Tax=Perkinsus marinus (strain ATCC 50983 / TXsc) TaxID=423536 RepID=C5L2Z5_PERM5|nr:conserved hypothetical protein [Perkinsus marinus ATCC 50983]EER08882.1 conserved hypothetical protein [Perkinsus marinus ATCC 50983]|eukprot:XP_002777066.1 conserved hypothetical protein [Perkinsus marinus ATCC 50983]
MLSFTQVAKCFVPRVSVLGAFHRSFASYAGYKNILVDVDAQKGTALVTLNRPKSLNALCDDLMKELSSATNALDKDDAIHAIVITGAGEKAFAAGADIKEMNSRQTMAEVYKQNMLAFWQDLANVKKPVIAAVNGYALGGGCELAMMCDIALASEKAVFAQPEVTLGTIPGAGGSQRLTRVVGKSLAMELCLTGRHMPAEEALRRGLVSHVYASEELVPKALEMAEKIASFSAPAIAMTKEAVNRAYETTLAEGLRFERNMFHATWALEDRKEGMTAFVEKRQAQWKNQ